MKIKTNIIALVVIAITQCVVAENIGSIFGNTIITDIELAVPSEYSTINEAVLYLDDKRIASDSTVTIQVADGTYTNYSTIKITHPDSSRIHLLGNITDPSQVVLSFSSNQVGVFCEYGNHLGLINGFTLTSDGTGTGLEATRSSSIRTGSKMIITDFNAGIISSWNSTIQCAGIEISDCTTHGALAANGSIYMDSATVSNCVYGVFSNASSYIQFQNGSSTGSTYGLRSLSGSYIKSTGATSTGNTINTEATDGGQIGN